MINTLEFETEAVAHDYMTAHAEVDNNTLASGVGNNTRTPFYQREGSYHYIWHPNGAYGNIIRIGFTKRFCEYNPDTSNVDNYIQWIKRNRNNGGIE
tara:strand:- start:95 stop:385 length:291 start_codon:yes stop_codon:yes gene_type:complete